MSAIKTDSIVFQPLALIAMSTVDDDDDDVDVDVDTPRRRDVDVDQVMVLCQHPTFDVKDEFAL